MVNLKTKTTYLFVLRYLFLEHSVSIFFPIIYYSQIFPTELYVKCF